MEPLLFCTCSAFAAYSKKYDSPTDFTATEQIFWLWSIMMNMPAETEGECRHYEIIMRKWRAWLCCMCIIIRTSLLVWLFPQERSCQSWKENRALAICHHSGQEHKHGSVTRLQGSTERTGHKSASASASASAARLTLLKPIIDQIYGVTSQKIIIINVYVYKHTNRTVVSQCREYKPATDHNSAYHISNIRRSIPVFFFQGCNCVTQINAYSKEIRVCLWN
jgi:hypothetical protein